MNLIVAVDKNWAIGHENDLLFSLPGDMKHFRTLTTGGTVIMGRKTLDSFPEGKPLPNRRNIVLSRQEGLHYENAECYHSLEEALMQCDYWEDIYIIGGATVYEQAMPLADRLLITHVEDTPEQADAFFPIIDLALWKEVNREEHGTDEKHHYPYSFVDYERI